MREMAHVVLVEPEIAWNTGNAGRTCLAAGARLHLVRPLGFSLAERRVRRAGLDYWREVDPVVHDDFAAFERILPDLGEPIVLSAEAERSLYEIDWPARPVFIFGSEGTGLPPAIRRKYAGATARIPMVDGAVRSLNLSTAVGVVLFEWCRRQQAG